MVFNPKGSTVTHRRDFLVCDQLDAFTDFLIGAKFILEQWSVLFDFGKMKRMIAGWFTHKKETPEEKTQAQVLKTTQEQVGQEAEFTFGQEKLRKRGRKECADCSKRRPTRPETVNKQRLLSIMRVILATGCFKRYHILRHPTMGHSPFIVDAQGKCLLRFCYVLNILGADLHSSHETPHESKWDLVFIEHIFQCLKKDFSITPSVVCVYSLGGIALITKVVC